MPGIPWHAGLNRAQSDRKLTHRDMLFAVVADKLDLYSVERRLEKENAVFIVSYLINKSMYVMCLEDSNSSRQLSVTLHLPFYFNFRSPDLASRVLLMDTLFRVDRKNGNYE